MTSEYGSGLLPQHIDVLAARAVSPAVATARGYSSTDSKAELGQLGFSLSQRRAPALVIPVFAPSGQRVETVIRPDAPRVKINKKGVKRVLKYEWPWDHRSRLDVPPACTSTTFDPAVPLWITEGIPKGDALVAAGAGCVVAIQGTYGWLSKGVILPDWREVMLKDRDVRVCFDSDAATNKHVALALGELVGFLENHGARVLVCDLPSDNGHKVGVDDYLAAGGTLESLISLARPPYGPDEPDDPDNSEKSNADAGPGVRIPNRTTPGQLPDLAGEPDILSTFSTEVERAGLAGETNLAKLLYLAMTSRVLPWGSPGNRPVSVMPRGTSGSGKSHTVGSVLSFFPEESYLNLGSMSRRYLLYMTETLSHKMLIVPELASIAEDEDLLAALRTLLSEGRLIHGTVDGDGKRQARRIEKAGPTGLIITTTAAIVDAELETRLLSTITDDTPEQTRRVFAALAAVEDSSRARVDYEPWVDLQRWIAEEAETSTVIPYISDLAALMPTSATRLRRDFVSLLCLIRASALLHQVNRERDGGRVVADIEDYSIVNGIVSDLFAEAVDATVSAAIRATVEAVEDLCSDGREHTSVKALAGRLKVGRTATYDRVRRALAQGWLVNVAAKDERGLKLAVGAAMPDAEARFLPDPADVLSGMSDRSSDNGKGPSPGVSSELSDRPGRPVESGPEKAESFEKAETALRDAGFTFSVITTQVVNGDEERRTCCLAPHNWPHNPGCPEDQESWSCPDCGAIHTPGMTPCRKCLTCDQAHRPDQPCPNGPDRWGEKILRSVSLPDPF